MKLIRSEMLKDHMMLLFQELAEGSERCGKYGIIRVMFNVTKWNDLVGLDTSDKKYFDSLEMAEREFERIKLFSQL